MIEFNNLLELKERITPALTTKVKEINSYVTEEDIEEYARSDKNDKSEWKFRYSNVDR